MSIPFRLDVAAGVKKGVPSLALPSPSILQEILVIFPLATSNLLKYRFFDDMMAKVPPTGDVGGLDVFRETMDKGEFVGDNIAYIIPHHYPFHEAGHYLKFQAENGTSSPMVASAIALLERI